MVAKNRDTLIEQSVTLKKQLNLSNIAVIYLKFFQKYILGTYFVNNFERNI